MAKKSKAQTPEEIAEERIAEWKLDSFKPHPRGYAKFGAKTEWLDLADLGLKKIPESLRAVHNLELVLLFDNKIKELPGWIGELPELKALPIQRNKLRELPTEIGLLSKLTYLALESNELESLPDSLGTLPLTDLDLNRNPKLGIPESILEDVNNPKKNLRYYFESREEKGQPLLELKLLLVGRGKAFRRLYLAFILHLTKDYSA